MGKAVFRHTLSRRSNLYFFPSSLLFDCACSEEAKGEVIGEAASTACIEAGINTVTAKTFDMYSFCHRGSEPQDFCLVKFTVRARCVVASLP